MTDDLLILFLEHPDELTPDFGLQRHPAVRPEDKKELLPIPDARSVGLAFPAAAVLRTQKVSVVGLEADGAVAVPDQGPRLPIVDLGAIGVHAHAAAVLR